MSVRAPQPAERRRRSIGPKQRDKFLDAIRAGFSIAHAATQAGFDRRRAYELRKTDETFAAAWEEALDVGTQVLEDIARRIAVEGLMEEHFDQDGKSIRKTRRDYPPMVMFLLKSRRPDVYRDNATAKVEVSGPNGGAIELDAGYKPTTLRDVVVLAQRLGLASGDVVDGEVVEDAELLELEAGEDEAA